MPQDPNQVVKLLCRGGPSCGAGMGPKIECNCNLWSWLIDWLIDWFDLIWFDLIWFDLIWLIDWLFNNYALLISTIQSWGINLIWQNWTSPSGGSEESWGIPVTIVVSMLSHVHPRLGWLTLDTTSNIENEHRWKIGDLKLDVSRCVEAFRLDFWPTKWCWQDDSTTLKNVFYTLQESNDDWSM